MLKQRFLTALILISAIFIIIYYLEPWFFTSVLLIFTLICGWEWLQLIPIKTIFGQLGFLFGLSSILLWLINNPINNLWLLGASMPWLLIAGCIGFFPKSQYLWGSRLIVAGFALYCLPLFVITAVNLYSCTIGKMLVMCLLLLVWAADIGAYIFGKLWGKYKLIPAVSPGKTVEGLLGGAMLTMITSIIIYLYLKPNQFTPWMIMTVSVFIMALIGDLFISMLKRRAKLKDTSVLLPGHGGVLDRLDSLIAATPVFYVQYAWINHF